MAMIWSRLVCIVQMLALVLQTLEFDMPNLKTAHLVVVIEWIL